MIYCCASVMADMLKEHTSKKNVFFMDYAFKRFILIQWFSQFLEMHTLASFC
jgi:hypothetical protein